MVTISAPKMHGQKHIECSASVSATELRHVMNNKPLHVLCIW